MIAACIGVTCSGGTTCLAHGWQEGNYTCACPPGTSGTNCSNGVLGTNFYQQTVTNLMPSHQYGFGTGISIFTPPVAKFDWTVALVFIPVVETPDPTYVELILLSPGWYATLPVFSSTNKDGTMGGCNSLNGVPIYDNNTAQWGKSSSATLCSATKISPMGLFYDDPSDSPTCFVGGCDWSADTGTTVSDPFARVYSMGNATTTGVWYLQIYDNNPGNTTEDRSTVTSWTLQFYSRHSGVFFLVVGVVVVVVVVVVELNNPTLVEDGCIGNQCQNGATCVATGWKAGNFTCACATGFSAQYCQTSSGSNCTETSPGIYNCTCLPGYIGNGTVCTRMCHFAPFCVLRGGLFSPLFPLLAINNCTNGNNNCSPNATCTYTGPAIFTCACNIGFNGTGTNCTGMFLPSLSLASRADLSPSFLKATNYCTNGGNNCAKVGSTCTYTGPGTYTCACNTGYTGTGTTCTAINNCTNGNNNCATTGSSCNSTGPGTFFCSCTANYTGNGTVCTGNFSLCCVRRVTRS